MKPLPRWAKWSLTSVATVLAMLVLVLLLAVSTNFGARYVWRFAQAISTSAGVPLSGDLVEGRLMERVQLQNLRMQQQGENGSALNLQIRQFTLQWRPWLLFGGRLQVDRIDVQGVSGTFVPGTDSEPEPPGEPLTHERLREQLFGLPVAIHVDAVSVANVDFSVGETRIGTDVLRFSARLDESALVLDSLTWGWQPHGVSGALRLDSDFLAQLELDWRTAVAGLDYRGVLNVTGSLDELALEHRLQAPQQLLSTGTLEPGMFEGQTLRFDLHNEASAIDLAVWGVEGAGLADVRLDASGTPEAVVLDASLVASYPELPDTTATLALRWENEMVLLDGLQLNNPELEFNVTGSVAPTPVAAQLAWRLDRLDPGERFPSVQLVGVTGNGTVEVRQEGEAFLTRVEIAELGGSLNDLPLAIEGTAALRDALPEQLDLSARSGDNRLELTGGMSDTLALQWNLQAPQLDQLWTALRGNISGTGSIEGTLEAPELDGNLTARNIAIALEEQRLSLASLSLEAAYQGGENQLTLTLDDLAQNGETLLDALRLDLQGTPEAHELRARADSLYGVLQLALAGGLSDGTWNGTLQQLATDSDFGDWTLRAPVTITAGAESQSLSLLCLDFQSTSLCAEASGDAAAGLDAEVNLTGLPLTWLNRNAPGKPAGIQALQDENEANLPAGLSIEGTLDLSATLAGLREGAWRNLQVAVQPAGLVLQLQQDLEEEGDGLDVRRFSFKDIVIEATNSNDTWQARLGLSVADETTPSLNGRLDADVSLRNNEALGGTVDINFPDLAWVQTLTPLVRDTRGALRGTADLGGTIDDPQVVAFVNLSDGGLRVPDYGLDITPLTLEVRSSADNTISLRAQAHSGEGDLALEAIVTQALAPERTMSAQLVGNGFTAVNMPGATATLSPDLRVNLADNVLTLTGTTTLDSAAIDLETILGQVSTSSAVNVSPDVVIVRTGDDANAAAQGNEIGLRIDTSLSLGDTVTITGYGLNASLGGDLSVEQDVGRPLLVYGELNVPEGSYEAYNQRLDIGDGRVLFFGNPANPVLDLRAKRETDRAEVGLKLSGTVSRMQGELYSVPELPENEILALLVTGKSFSDVDSQDSDALLSSIANFGLERGQGLTNSIGNKLGLDSLAVSNEGGSLDNSALGLGKYITPKLLMQYKVGLFDRQAVLSLNYTLTERLKLEVQSGVNQSVDINYTYEKD